MPKYIITYDLNKEGDYKAKSQVVESAIREIGRPDVSPDMSPAVRAFLTIGGFRQPSPRLTTVWIGETSMSLQQVYDHVREVMDKDDDLFVGELGECRPC